MNRHTWNPILFKHTHAHTNTLTYTLMYTLICTHHKLYLHSRWVCDWSSDPCHEPVLAPDLLQVCQLPCWAGRHRLCQEPRKVSGLGLLQLLSPDHPSPDQSKIFSITAKKHLLQSGYHAPHLEINNCSPEIETPSLIKILKVVDNREVPLCNIRSRAQGRTTILCM